MAGASTEHHLIAANLIGGLVGLTRKSRRCGVFTSDQRIHVPATGLYTYADGGVVCGKREIEQMCLLNPLLLFEVLSPSTRDYDRGSKGEHYEAIPSLRHLLLIDQPDRRIWHHRRTEGGLWRVTEITEGAVELAELGGAVLLEDVYRLPE